MKIQEFMNTAEKLIFKIGKYVLLIHPPTRDWVFRQVRGYAALIIAVILTEIVLLTTATLVFVPWLRTMIFMFSLVLMMLSYIPAGVARNLAISETPWEFIGRSLSYKYLYPGGIRHLAGYLAFAGWLGIIHTSWLNFWTVSVSLFIFFIFDAFSRKYDVKPSQARGSNPLILAFVVILTALAIWENTSPVLYKSSLGLYLSWTSKTSYKEVAQTIKNNASISVMYVKPNQKIGFRYYITFSKDKQADSIKGDSVKITEKDMYVACNPNQGVVSYQGQGFIEVRDIDYIGSSQPKPFWLRADQVDIVTPDDIADVKNEANQKRKVEAPKASADQSTTVGPATELSTPSLISCGPGTYQINLKKGEESQAWYSIECYHSYTFEKGKVAKFYLVYKDGTTANSWTSGQWPPKSTFKIVNLSDEAPMLVVM